MKRLSFLFIGADGNDHYDLSIVLAEVLLEAIESRYRVTSEILHEESTFIPAEAILDCQPSAILAIWPIEIKEAFFLLPQSRNQTFSLISPEEFADYLTLNKEYAGYLEEIMEHLERGLGIPLFWLAPLPGMEEKLGEKLKESLGSFPIIYAPRGSAGKIFDKIRSAAARFEKEKEEKER